jgi:hypothetical protein
MNAAKNSLHSVIVSLSNVTLDPYMHKLCDNIVYSLGGESSQSTSFVAHIVCKCFTPRITLDELETSLEYLS